MDAKLEARDTLNATAPERLLPPRMARSCSNATASDIVCEAVGKGGVGVRENGAGLPRFCLRWGRPQLSRRERSTSFSWTVSFRVIAHTNKRQVRKGSAKMWRRIKSSLTRGDIDYLMADDTRLRVSMFRLSYDKGFRVTGSERRISFARVESLFWTAGVELNGDSLF